VILPLPDPQATARLGGALAGLLRPGDVVCLCGPLGAGKTTLARGLIAAATGEREAPSPTFALVETYEGGPAPIWHFDLYRLERAEDVFELGLEEALGEAIVLVEWPERIAAMIPDDALFVRLEAKDGARRAMLAGGGDWPARLAGGGIASAAESPKTKR
jgi:tRNA threonylcarbamoyladenosine biosynthesis protein TsaE